MYNIRVYQQFSSNMGQTIFLWYNNRDTVKIQLFKTPRL